MSVLIYSTGLCCVSACAPVETPREEVERAVNEEYPSGVSPWHISEDETFAGGEPMPAPCEQGTGRQHWLLNC